MGGFAGALPPPSSGRRRRPPRLSPAPESGHMSLMNMRRYDYENMPRPEYGIWRREWSAARANGRSLIYEPGAAPPPVITVYLVRARDTRAPPAAPSAQSRFRWREVRPAATRSLRLRTPTEPSAARASDPPAPAASALPCAGSDPSAPACSPAPTCRESSPPASAASPSVLTLLTTPHSPQHTTPHNENCENLRKHPDRVITRQPLS